MNQKSIFSLCAFIFLFNSTLTIIIGYLPVYFQYKGFSGNEIGWLLAIGPFAAIISQPLTGYLSDKWKTVKKIITFCLVLLTLSSIVMFQITSFLLLMFISYIFFFFLSPIGGLGDSLAQKTSSTLQIPFGRIRMWGSIGFASVSLLTGKILSIVGVENILYPLLFFSISCIVVSLLLADVTISKKPVKILDAFTLLKDKKVLLFLGLILLFAIPHRINDFYIGLYIKEIGGSEMYIGWAWFIGATIEAFVFFFSSKWASRYHELSLLIFIGTVYTGRFIALSFIESPLILLFLQPLHGITFAIFYTAALQYISKIVPDYLIGTGHQLLTTIFFGLSGIIASLLGGLVFEQFGGATLYFSIGFVVLLGSILTVPYRKVMRLQSSTTLYGRKVG